MISVNIATHIKREELLKSTVKSLLRQSVPANVINVYLNDYDKIPDFLKAVNPILGNKDLGDNGKFYNCDNFRGYYLTCDDDIIYPKDYIETILKYIDKKKVLSFHGRKFTTNKIHSYYRDYNQKNYNCSGLVEQNQKVDVIGTGCMAIKMISANDPFIKLQDFKHKNMSDIFVSIQLKQQYHELNVIKHAPGWLKLQEDKNDSIYWHNRSNDKIQTNLVNKYILK